jgi:hypothetical protein
MLICKTGSGIWTKCVCVLCFCYFINSVCNKCDSVCCKWISELHVKCNVWCVMLNDAILVVNELVWNPSWFRLTTGIIWAQVWKFEHFGACFCTCALIIWSVLLQVLCQCPQAHPYFLQNAHLTPRFSGWTVLLGFAVRTTYPTN